MRNTIVTYIYPGCESDIKKFVNACNDAEGDFSVTAFNDGLVNAAVLFKDLLIDFKIIDIEGSINAIRHKSFNILKNLSYQNFIFQDIDDTFSTNRVIVCDKLLNTYDIVICDLNIVFPNGENINNYWKNRITEGELVNVNNILDYNFLGLGNTAITKKILEINTSLDVDVIAYDWFYFYQILSTNKFKVIFTSKCNINYYQHANNTAGLNKNIDNERIQYVKNVKLKHYSALLKIGYNEVFDAYSKIKTLKIIDTNMPKVKGELFWWEEI